MNVRNPVGSVRDPVSGGLDWLDWLVWLVWVGLVGLGWSGWSGCPNSGQWVSGDRTNGVPLVAGRQPRPLELQSALRVGFACRRSLFARCTVMLREVGGGHWPASLAYPLR